MTPGERRELRTVVRQRMKVLRADVEQRRMELVAEAEQRLMERYRDQDKVIEDLNWRIQQIADQAGKDITDAILAVRGETDGVSIRRPIKVNAPRLSSQIEDRTQLHRALIAGIEAQVKRALLELDRQEADLLETLALSAVETDAAREFLAAIPTVGELVPAARLKEIEAAFDRGGGAR
jgi:lipopolysaccharide biosynthesis regulator YciM